MKKTEIPAESTSAPKSSTTSTTPTVIINQPVSNKNETSIFDYANDFFKNNPDEYNKVKSLLKQVISKFSQDALNHTNFCNLFATPHNLTNVILKILNLSDKQVADAFYKKANFFQGNAMHQDSYYQTLLLLYYVGLKRDDHLMRLYSLTLLYAKMYNGRRITYFPNGCIDEVASYILNNVMRGSHNFKKYRTPFQLVVEYLAPSLDETYAMRIRNDPFHPTDGLIKILVQAWARIDQIFMGVQKHYYSAYNAGNKDVKMVSSTDDMYEQVDHGTDIEKLADKVNRALFLKKYEIDAENSRLILKNILLPQHYLDKVENFLKDNTQDEEEILKPIFEAVLSAFHIHDETGICNMNISAYAAKITGNQTDLKITQFKNLVEAICKKIFSEVFTTQVYNQQQKIRRLVITMLLFRIKAALCKNVKYDAI
jgi:hypothetical protein